MYDKFTSRTIKEEDRWENGQRICNDCRTYLPPDSFGKCSQSFDGFRPQCRNCRKKSESKYRENNPEADWVKNNYDTVYSTDHRYDSEGNRYCQTCKTHISPLLFYSNSKYKDGLDRRCKNCNSKMNSEYRSKNKEKLSTYFSEYYQNNKDRLRSVNSFRRYRKKAKYGEHVDYETIKSRDNMMCYLCGEKIESDLHIDHIEPVSKGGNHTEDNLSCTHQICNLKKGSKTLLMYLLEQRETPSWMWGGNRGWR